MEEKVNLYGYVVVLKKRCKLFLAVFALIMILGLIYTLTAQKKFKSKVTFFFPSDQGASSSLMQNALKDLPGGLLKNEQSGINSYALSILESRTISDRIIDEYGKQLFGSKNKLPREKLYKKLEKLVNVEKNEEDIIEITVTTHNPKLSAGVAKLYVDEYKKFTKKTIHSMDSVERHYIERQRDLMKKELAKIQNELLQFQQKKKIIDISNEIKSAMAYRMQLRSMLISSRIEYKEANTTLENTRAQFIRHARLSNKNLSLPVLKDDTTINNLYLKLTEAELELAKSRNVYKETHPRIKTIKKEVGDIKRSIRNLITARLSFLKDNLTDELIVLESKALAKKAQMQALEKLYSEATNSLNKLPELSLKYTNLIREMKIKEAIYGHLEMELQNAKIKEIKAEGMQQAQILDPAQVPDYKSSPKHILNMAITFFLALIVSLIVVFSTEYWDEQRKMYRIQQEETSQ